MWNKKNIIKFVLVLFAICIFFMPIVEAKIKWYTPGMSIEAPSSGDLDRNSSSMKTLSKIWNTIKLMLQVAAVGTFIYAGVKYMFASADQKADLKKSLGILIIGAIIAFGATLIVDFVVNIVKDVPGTATGPNVTNPYQAQIDALKNAADKLLNGGAVEAWNSFKNWVLGG